MSPVDSDDPYEQSYGNSGNTQEGAVTSDHEHHGDHAGGGTRHLRGDHWRSDADSAASAQRSELQSRGGLLEDRWDGLVDGDGEYQDPLVPLGQTARSIHLSQFHRGPLPPASELAKYDEVNSTFAERIVRMAEIEVGTREYAVRKAVDAEAFVQRSSPFVSVAMMVVFGLVALLLHTSGASTLAVAFVGGAGPILMGVSYIISALRDGAPPRQPAASDGDDD